MRRRTYNKIIADLQIYIDGLESKVAYLERKLGNQMKKGAAKVGKVMREYEHGTLHSGSKKGPKVTDPAQAKAIALSEARKAGAKITKKGK